MKIKNYIVLLLAMMMASYAKAQDVAVKTNLPVDATATVNAGIELGLSSRWTLDLSGSFNAWNVSDNRTWKHWMVQPEARYWLCDRFSGHFFGLHLHGGQYNLGNLNNGIKFLGTDFSKLSDSRYQGWFVGAGIGYGYSWILNERWNLEAEIGLGYSYTRYEKYPCADCGDLEEKGNHHYVGVTKAALNLIYVF
jgi:putative salt-induced outer membrane protein YdiY